MSAFAQRGYDATSIRDVAAAAGVSVALVYRCFPTKEHFAIALYDRLANALVERAVELPTGTVAERFVAAMRFKLELVAPHRRTLIALAARAIDPAARAAVFGTSTEVVRSKVSGVFWLVVSGSTDAPREGGARLAGLLYALHLGLVLLSLQDEDGALAQRTLELVAVALPTVGDGPITALAAAGLYDAFGGLLGTSRTAEGSSAIARRVLDRVLARRRVLPGTSATPTEAARALHLPLVEAFVDAGEPIHLVLPAFPAKAPNPQKVLGTLPDMAEVLALRSLIGLLDEIAEAYRPGAELVICSDGQVFADAVGVRDEDVAAYRRGMQALVDETGDTRIRIFGLEDAFGVQTPSAARALLMESYAESTESIRARAASNPTYAAQVDGIHRFLFEDEIVRSPTLSRTKVRKQTRDGAYEVVRRSEAWGALVLAAFPRALRLSIHPQAEVSSKIGISLLDTDDCWLTPWHGVAVLGGERARLMHRADAESIGAVLVSEDGRASHMEIPA